jgi:peptidoglycan glycosyltransferase
VNKEIARLYGFVILLFAVLIAFTSRWTVFDATSLRSNKLNVRPRVEQEYVARGPIVAADGSTLAQSVRESEGTFIRRYPFGAEFAQAIGFYYPVEGSAGLERYRNAPLAGQERSSLQTILDQLQGKTIAGDRVVTALRPKAQSIAISALGTHKGAVVALNPKTGAIEVMASTPSFDPNKVATTSGSERLDRAPGSPLLNRAVQDGYAPGSTFKIVTATAAIDTGKFTPQSALTGKNDLAVSGVPLGNDNNESFGEISLTQAFTKSVNTVWAQVAEKLGKATIARYMDSFGFERKPMLDYPADEMSPSGEFLNGHILAPTSDLVDVGRMGIGEDKLNATPLQMAEVAAAVANDGRLMVPHLTDRIVDPEGRVVSSTTPRVQSVVMKPSTATAVRAMMESVVNEGTGSAAQIPGIQVAGKTGTAETQIGTNINNVWFVAFAPAANPTVAIAVTVEDVPGFGGTFAAPVAREVLQALLHE